MTSTVKCERAASRMTPPDLFNLSQRAGTDEFLDLIEEVNTTLDGESGRVGSLRITGKLVNIPPAGELVVIGDLHGDLKCLEYILKDSAFLEKAEQGDSVFMVFLGDYGDRGAHSPEVYYIALRLKATYPEQVILMRGNHEGPDDLLAYPHDLPTHLHRKFGEGASVVYNRLRRLFGSLYIAVLVQDRYILLHGGVPSQASTIEDLAYAHVEHPAERHLEAILWSDPHDGIRGVRPSPRGAGELFGEDVTDEFLRMLGVRVLIRGHEPSDEGFKMNHGGKVLTLFSRKGPPYNNAHGAYLRLNLSEAVESASQLTRHIHKF